jgi:hypothetical protein
MPEVAIRICEFDRDLPSAALSRIDVHHAAFAFFLCEAVDDEDLLAEFYARLHVEQPTVQAHCQRGGYFAEGMIARAPTVNFDGDGKRDALAAATFNHRNLLRIFKNWPIGVI